jgi:hypothetical protein
MDELEKFCVQYVHKCHKKALEMKEADEQEDA